MKRLPMILVLLIILSLSPQAAALDITAPTVPESGRELMPENTESFGQGVLQILRSALDVLRPDIGEAAGICVSILAVILLLSLLEQLPGRIRSVSNLAGTVAISGLLLSGTHSMLNLGAKTVTELSEYGKLLLPVMTAALAAQGGVGASAALYTGTAAFNALLTAIISRLLIPMILVFLALSAANSALGEDMLKQLQGTVKWACTWCLKTVLYVFTGYMGITGVVSGTTDAAALKATKLTISGMVPVVGGILSDASETVLVSAGLVKNAAGVYGILAILSVCLGPFLRIGVHYLLLKATGAVCGVFGPKGLTGLIRDFTGAMGMLLAMTGSECLLLLVSTVCFLRGVG